jgi:hypothetical protein
MLSQTSCGASQRVIGKNSTSDVVICKPGPDNSPKFLEPTIRITRENEEHMLKYIKERYKMSPVRPLIPQPVLQRTFEIGSMAHRTPQEPSTLTQNEAEDRANRLKDNSMRNAFVTSNLNNLRPQNEGSKFDSKSERGSLKSACLLFPNKAVQSPSFQQVQSSSLLNQPAQQFQLNRPLQSKLISIDEAIRKPEVQPNIFKDHITVPVPSPTKKPIWHQNSTNQVTAFVGTEATPPHLKHKHSSSDTVTHLAKSSNRQLNADRSPKFTSRFAKRETSKKLRLTNISDIISSRSNLGLESLSQQRPFREEERSSTEEGGLPKWLLSDPITAKLRHLTVQKRVAV